MKQSRMFWLRAQSSEFKKGFTLVELLLVVIIISVLAAMVVPRMVGRSEQAKISVAKADIEGGISLALDMFEVDNGRLPTTEEGLEVLLKNQSSLPKWKGPYIKKLPKDPWGKSYLYKVPGTHDNDYDLYSAGPNGTEGDSDDIGNW
jgi:general secretion pathway protein G